MPDVDESLVSIRENWTVIQNKETDHPLGDYSNLVRTQSCHLDKGHRVSLKCDGTSESKMAKICKNQVILKTLLWKTMQA